MPKGRGGGGKTITTRQVIKKKSPAKIKKTKKVKGK